MTRQEAFVALNLVTDIGSVKLERLLQFFNKPENIFKAPLEKLRACGLDEKVSRKITGLKKNTINKEFIRAKKLGLGILILGEPGYPASLNNIPSPPLVLYIKGRLEEKDEKSIAIVGSRRASFYGISSAEKFAQGLAEAGFSIISGMARGIDTAAHKGALKARARTIAVMGSGFNQLYPPENRALSEEIAANGAVVSEFGLDILPLPHNFPRRNRVVSGLSMGVLVVEAAKRSGALITADFALEQGREVFALPGKIDSDNSFGTNELIKQGAKLVSSVEDILEEFSFQFDQPLLQERRSKLPITPGLDGGEESGVFSFLSEQPVSLDELVERAKLDIIRISDILLRLQLKKIVKQLPGKLFVRSSHEK
ncbi:MAG: DNA-protecting protein DprA [Candidatus Omnitrophica bacterium]|nr:DNA-protecting protein DprA [Candidatus Omnitrophota bacterium]